MGVGVEDVEVQVVSSSQVCKGVAIQLDEKGCQAGRYLPEGSWVVSYEMVIGLLQ